ncbi:MAG: HEAT repeat domain-containing protein, partial [Armatimonadetes bacterium]|nr:HEAT repeat domain-containing protein [Armatimonadota bacterium]
GQAIAALGEIGAREAAAQLRQLYDIDPGRHRIRLIRALQQLGDEAPLRQEIGRLSETALGSADARARRQAVQTLSWLAREQAQETFRRALEDPDEAVRREAERALRGGGGEGRRGQRGV